MCTTYTLSLLLSEVISFLFRFTEYPTPRLICPPNQLLELPEDSNKVQVKLQKPKTDVNFKRDITIKPSWIKNEKISLGVGEFNVSYTAKHPISKLTISCTTSIFVVGKLVVVCGKFFNSLYSTKGLENKKKKSKKIPTRTLFCYS